MLYAPPPNPSTAGPRQVYSSPSYNYRSLLGCRGGDSSGRSRRQTRPEAYSANHSPPGLGHKPAILVQVAGDVLLGSVWYQPPDRDTLPIILVHPYLSLHNLGDLATYARGRGFREELARARSKEPQGDRGSSKGSGRVNPRIPEGLLVQEVVLAGI
jgi:hypothetical protein